MKARRDQIPHGANELVVWEEQTVGRLRGTVRLANGEPAGDVVVEIYRYEGAADGFETTRVLKNTQRLVACLTRKEGLFAFKGLKAGRYLLRAGTVAPAGINELHAIFRVTGNGKAQNVEIRLSMGT